MQSVEILAIGNELLIGDTLDTNTHWICKKITGIGGHVARSMIVRDQREAIVQAIHLGLQSNPALLIVTGGLGPTMDDMTLGAVAEALDCPLVLHPQAKENLQKHYEKRFAQGVVEFSQLTKEREKMAWLPQGSIPLDNPVGAAPGVLLSVRASKVVCLPGVPSELKGIFNTSLRPTLKAIFGDRQFLEKEIVVHCRDESKLAPLLREVTEQNPDVYVKSKAGHYGLEVKLRIILSASGASAEEVHRKVDAALHDLESKLQKIRVAIESVTVVSQEDGAE